MFKARLLGVAALVIAAMTPTIGHAATDCTFSVTGTTMTLDADCTTDSTIGIPDGMTLDGANNTITAVDPAGDHFRGAVVGNLGSTAWVTNLRIAAGGLANVCDGGDDRLRGVMFEGASGAITDVTIAALNQGASGCQEGNAIEVRNAPFDGTHPDTQTVVVAGNTLRDWQKTGIVANGDVDVHIHHNDIGESATQLNLAPNSIQLGFGALGLVEHNHLDGNQWLGASNFAATGILLFAVDGTEVSKNHIGGNSDVGIYTFGEGNLVDKNHVTDNGLDGPHGDFGLVNFGDNTITSNHIKGFDTPTSGVTEDAGPGKGKRNKTSPGGPLPV